MKCYPLRSRFCQCSAHNPSYPPPCSRTLSPNEVRLEQPAPEAPCQWAVLRLLEVFVSVFVLPKYIELLKWPGTSVPPPIKPLTNASRCWNINTQALLLQSGQLEGMPYPLWDFALYCILTCYSSPPIPTLLFLYWFFL